MSGGRQDLLRVVPSIDELLRIEQSISLTKRYGRELVTRIMREVTDELRVLLTEHGDGARARAAPDVIVQEVSLRVDAASKPNLRTVFNLTGTVLHTNLGRAPLARAALDAMTTVASGASNVEYDLKSGRRGDRDAHVEALICQLTGAEAATIVNNNAAAVLLVLNTLAKRKEVLVSRGELIEIGDAFRIPDVMSRAGAKLVEVGTTNRTHLVDYEQALNERTTLLMKVHTSNYVIQGFTSEVSEKELASLSVRHEIPLVVDLGSGTLIDLTRYGLPHEATVSEVLEEGVDLVTFSGDKLLGGPQSGIIAGRRDLVRRVKRNPMKRALRVDKLTIAALEATLRLYLDPERLIDRLPALAFLTRSATDIEALAQRLVSPLRQVLGKEAVVRVISCRSQIGSGALPVDLLGSAAISITLEGQKGRAIERLAGAFRSLPSPVIGRIENRAFVMDLRCLDDEEGFAQQLDSLKIARR